MSVKQCQREIDAREFEEWLLYSEVEPWGEWRADLRAGIVASTLANVNRGKDVPPFVPSDFMPHFDAVPEQEEDIDEDAGIELTQNIFESLTLQLGGTIQE